MEPSEGKSDHLIPISIVVAGFLIAASFYVTFAGPSRTTTTTVTLAGSTSTATSTLTETSVQTEGPSPINITASFDVWTLSAHLDATVLSQGQQLNFTFYVENTWTQNESIAVTNPLANPEIYSQDGQLVWSYQQSATTALQQVPPGGKIYGRLLVPTSELQAGQTYIFTSSPNIGTAATPESMPIGQYLQIYAEITILPT